jgi:hypothetical protein
MTLHAELVLYLEPYSQAVLSANVYVPACEAQTGLMLSGQSKEKWKHLSYILQGSGINVQSRDSDLEWEQSYIASV